MKGKRGQVVLFIIFGLVLIMLVSLGFVYRTVTQADTLGTEAREAIEQSIPLYPPQKYVEYCLNYHLPPLARAMAHHGGTLFPQDYESFDRDVRMWYTLESGNALVGRESVADELAESLRSRMEGCLDMGVYTQQGFEVSAGQLSILNLTVAEDRVHVLIDFPITITTEDEVFSKDSFAAEVDVPLGKALRIAHSLVNTHVSDGDVDVVRYMVGHPELRLMREKPYPFIVYTLNISHKDDPFALRFAMETEDPFTSPMPVPSGCCQLGADCFLSSRKESCLAEGGFFNADFCSCPVVDYGAAEDTYMRLSNLEQVQCEDGPCQNCGTARHGESWCGSVDGVGGRHFRQFCIDGVEHVEECKDYRQEVCAETDVLGLRRAQCRPNRHSDCVECTSESCCTDSLRRDCKWISEDVGCRPLVSPGLRFWEDASEAYCSGATTICDDCEIDSLSLLESCVSAGDCGNQLNAYGEASTAGMLGMHAYSQADYLAMLEATDHSEGLKYFPYEMFHNLSHSSQLTGQVRGGQLSRVIHSALEVIDQLSFVSLADYLDPSKAIDMQSLVFSYCRAWHPPEADACGYCMQMPVSCSEYMCRSLGDECRFARIDGRPFCYAMEHNDNTQPQVLGVYHQSSLDPQGLLQQDELGGLEGYRYKEAIDPQHPIEAYIKTSEPTQCKVSYLPGKSYDELSGTQLSSHRFVGNHSLKLRFINNMEVLDRFLAKFNSSSYLELADQLTELKNTLEILSRRHPRIERFRSGYYSLIAPLVEHYMAHEHRQMTELLLQEAEKGEYYLFFACVDAAGNQNAPTFLHFRFRDPCNDTEAPDFSAMRTGTRGISVVGDEYLTCRYDVVNLSYTDMSFPMDCPDSMYAIDPHDDMYHCSAHLHRNISNATKVYVACADHPEWDVGDEAYQLSLDVDRSEQARGFVSRVINKSISVLHVNVSDEFPTQLSLRFPAAYSCMMDGVALSCSLQECRAELHEPGVHQVYCVPRPENEAICRRERNIAEPKVLDLDVAQTAAGRMQMGAYYRTSENAVVAWVSSEHAACQFDWRGTVSTMEPINQTHHQGIVEGFEAGVAELTVTCKSQDQMVNRSIIAVR
ncbi:MAG: hypothetical protein ACOCWQ_02255 [Nanoarchaeota archaeon]